MATPQIEHNRSHGQNQNASTDEREKRGHSLQVLRVIHRTRVFAIECEITHDKAVGRQDSG